MPDISAHQRFEAWARSRGIMYSKISPAHIPGAGLGVVSTAVITGPERTRQDQRVGFTAGEDIAFCPRSALLNRETVHQFCPWLPASSAGANANANADADAVPTHALLAAAIALERNNREHAHRPWMDVWPSLESFRESMPLLWAAEQRALLPPAAAALVDAQIARFRQHRAAVAEKLGIEFDDEDWTWAWMVVNTRSLFYTPQDATAAAAAAATTAVSGRRDRPRDDCMTLCPFVDLFNHSDGGCGVDLRDGGYFVTTTDVHEPGEELFVSYGCHSNDFLLCEYGFVLDNNRWDEVAVDRFVAPRISRKRKDVLEREGFWGNYVFDGSTFCYRTQVVMRLLLIPEGTPSEDALVERWRAFLKGEDDGEREQVLVDESMLGLLAKIKEVATEKLETAERLGESYARTVLVTRWKQILEMAQGVEEKMKEIPEGVSIRKYMLGTY